MSWLVYWPVRLKFLCFIILTLLCVDCLRPEHHQLQKLCEMMSLFPPTPGRDAHSNWNLKIFFNDVIWYDYDIETQMFGVLFDFYFYILRLLVFWRWCIWLMLSLVYEVVADFNWSTEYVFIFLDFVLVYSVPIQGSTQDNRFKLQVACLYSVDESSSFNCGPGNHRIKPMQFQFPTLNHNSHCCIMLSAMWIMWYNSIILANWHCEA